MYINTNIRAIDSNRTLRANNLASQKTAEKLSSGNRINRAADDSAGLAVSEKMETQIRGLKQATSNANDAISFVQTVEGYTKEVSSILQRMRELGVQSANGIYTENDRNHIQKEVDQLILEIDRIGDQAEFNRLGIFRGDFSDADSPFYAHIGPNSDQNVSLVIDALNSVVMGLRDEALQGEEGHMKVTSVGEANQMISTVDAALDEVIALRTNLGSFQNRLESVVRSNETSYQNVSASKSRIKDADMAEHITELTRNSVLQQASLSMLAQANASSQNVLSLLN